MMVKDKKATTTTGSCDYTEEEYAITELVSANEYKKVKKDFESLKNTLYNKTLISSINNDIDTINSEINSIDLNEGEATNKKGIVDALQYSGLGITEESSWDEINNALSKYFPQTIDLANLDADKYAFSISNYMSTSAGAVSYKPLKTQAQLTSNNYGSFSIITKEYYDLTSFSKIVIGMTNSVTAYSSWGWYLIDEAGVSTAVTQQTWAPNSNYSTVADISQYKGKYRIGLFLYLEGHTTKIQTNINVFRLEH